MLGTVKRLARRALGGSERYVWKPGDVAGMVVGPHGKLLFRAETIPYLNMPAYLERRQLRAILQSVVKTPGAGRAAEIGCGFGRITMVLAEFFEDVHGFERELHLVETARRLQPEVTFHRVESLARLDLPDGGLDFAMTFAVLQHMTDADAGAVLAEINRLVESGHVLLVEKTDPAAVAGDPRDGSRFLSLGRPVETFADWMAPFGLVATWPRRVEPTYPSAVNVGTYMLFGRA